MSSILIIRDFIRVNRDHNVEAKYEKNLRAVSL
jgi:hypothetical protein